MISIFRRSLLPALALFAVASLSAPAQTISLPDNDLPTAGFGKGGTTTFGQTFTAPIGFNYLQTFSFWLSNDAGLTSNPGALLFQAYVMQWDAVNGFATGPVLYSSAVRSGPTSFSQRYDFAASNIALNGSEQYVAFLSASTQLSNIPGTDATAAMEASILGTYTGGQFVYTTNDANFGLLSTDPWEFTGFSDYQAHFEATFSSAAISVVPEPSSLALLISGGLAVLVVAMRRRRA